MHWAPATIRLAERRRRAAAPARRDGPADGEGVEAERRQGLARSETPLGPFRLDDAPLVRDVWSIDGHPFQDEDGTLWLFCNVRTAATRYRGMRGSGTVVDRLLAPDRLEGAPTPVALPSAPWEANRAGDGYWNEGSWVLKRRGRYHQPYSGGYYREPTYGIGGPGPVTGRPTEDPQPAPREPVHDPAVPFWHADLWLEGTGVRAGGAEVTLPRQSGRYRVRLNQNLHGLRIWVDGALRAQARGRHGPEIAVRGTVVAGALQSMLEDESVHWLAPGQDHTWPWGGSGPLELTLAVRGACRVRAGDVGDTLISPVERFALLHLTVPGGAGEIVVTGAHTGAQVTDVFAAAR